MRPNSNPTPDEILADTDYYEDRFWSNIIKSDGCWEWSGTLLSNGYGRLRIKYRLFLAHRVAWTLAHGPIPEGLVVCHACDNPRCVRPDHLWLGTLADNNRDMDEKGRGYRPGPTSERSRTTKLTVEQIREIRHLYEHGKYGGTRDLARRFGVQESTILRIVRRETWKHV